MGLSATQETDGPRVGRTPRPGLPRRRRTPSGRQDDAVTRCDRREGRDFAHEAAEAVSLRTSLSGRRRKTARRGRWPGVHGRGGRPPLSPEADDAALVGLDWAATKPDVCGRATGAARDADGVRGHRPEARARGANGLAARVSGSKSAVGLEPSTGRLRDALLKDAGWGLSPRPPRRVAKGRAASAPSGKPADQEAPMLRRASPDLGPRPPRLPHRGTSGRKGDFPPGLGGFAARDAPVVCDVLQRGPPGQPSRRRRTRRGGWFCR